MNWTVYNELAWTEHILAPPETYAEEAMSFIKPIKSHISGPSPTMLHLGCGAGGHDFHFKKYFSVTGVDLSGGMLELAQKTNPEVIYIKGDMRTVNLNKKFDIVAIPDSIMYMTTPGDLRKALFNAAGHLKPGGLLLVAGHMKEEFRENNFVYTGEKDGVHITLFENNHIVSGSTYEAAMIYLIRRGGELSVHHEVHTLGLFSYEQWMDIFKECRLKMTEYNLDHLYDKYLLEEGGYKMKVFVGTYS